MRTLVLGSVMSLSLSLPISLSLSLSLLLNIQQSLLLDAPRPHMPTRLDIGYTNDLQHYSVINTRLLFHTKNKQRNSHTNLHGLQQRKSHTFGSQHLATSPHTHAQHTQMNQNEGITRLPTTSKSHKTHTPRCNTGHTSQITRRPATNKFHKTYISCKTSQPRSKFHEAHTSCKCMHHTLGAKSGTHCKDMQGMQHKP